MINLKSMSSKWLLGIGIAAIVLIVASVVVALVNRHKESALISLDKPEGVTQRYLLDIRQGNFSSAYSYLNASLQQSCTYGNFLSSVSYYQNRDTGVTLVNTDRLDGKQEVIVRVTEYNVEPPFGGNEYSQTIHYVLEMEAGGWRFTEIPWPLTWCPGMQYKVPPPPVLTPSAVQ